ncbi:MAG: hypothetical protein AVDCRST_MAG41-39, partial [uncultured Corynebacteriales bacterium]
RRRRPDLLRTRFAFRVAALLALLGLLTSTVLVAIGTQAGPASAAITGRDLITGTWTRDANRDYTLTIRSDGTATTKYRGQVLCSVKLTNITGSWDTFSATEYADCVNRDAYGALTGLNLTARGNLLHLSQFNQSYTYVYWSRTVSNFAVCNGRAVTMEQAFRDVEAMRTLGATATQINDYKMYACSGYKVCDTTTSLSPTEVVRLVAGARASGLFDQAGLDLVKNDPCALFAGRARAGTIEVAGTGTGPGTGTGLSGLPFTSALDPRNVWASSSVTTRRVTLELAPNVRVTRAALCRDLATRFIIEYPSPRWPTIYLAGPGNGHLEVRQTVCAAKHPVSGNPVLTNGNATVVNNQFSWSPPDQPIVTAVSYRGALLSYTLPSTRWGTGVLNLIVDQDNTRLRVQVGAQEQIFGVGLPVGFVSGAPVGKTADYQWAATDICGGTGGLRCP